MSNFNRLLRNKCDTKTCLKCHQELSVYNFKYNPKAIDGRKSSCKACELRNERSDAITPSKRNKLLLERELRQINREFGL